MEHITRKTLIIGVNRFPRDVLLGTFMAFQFVMNTHDLFDLQRIGFNAAEFDEKLFKKIGD